VTSASAETGPSTIVAAERDGAKPRRSRWRKWLIALVVLVVLFAGATVRLFVLPARDSPHHVDAIFVLGGAGHRVFKGEALARAGYAPALFVSTGTPGCTRPIAGVAITCFKPDPFTTQGEARYIAAMVKRHGWKSIIVVDSTEQTTRARIRVQRCTNVKTYFVTTPPSTWSWPYHLAYEWAALGKALILQRGC
jgi:uncharacterized SAM-binding protein YcdF (DUF218 family)